MLFADGALGVALLVLWVFCVFDCITSDDSSVRNLPKLLWLLIVLLLPDVGSVLWLVAGRPLGRRRRAGMAMTPYTRRGIPDEYDRPGRAVASSPDEDEAFLASLKSRADEQRRRAEQERRRRESEEG